MEEEGWTDGPVLVRTERMEEAEEADRDSRENIVY